MKKNSILLAIFFIAIAAVARLLKHPGNFSPVGSMALFGGAIFASKYMKYLVPLIALYLSDLFLNNTVLRMWYPEQEGIILFHDYMLWSYFSFILAVIIGHYFINSVTAKKVIGAAIGFTVVFFLISNLGVWAGTNMYPKNIGGLLTCYAAGFPFLKSSLAGNLVYSTVLFGGYYWINSTYIERIVETN